MNKTKSIDDVAKIKSVTAMKPYNLHFVKQKILKRMEEFNILHFTQPYDTRLSKKEIHHPVQSGTGIKHNSPT